MTTTPKYYYWWSQSKVWHRNDYSQHGVWHLGDVYQEHNVIWTHAMSTPQLVLAL